MHPTQAKLIQLAQQLSSVAIQAATAYNQAQASLKVEEVLTPARLTSP